MTGRIVGTLVLLVVLPVPIAVLVVAFIWSRAGDCG